MKNGKADGLVVSVQAPRGRKRVNVIVQVEKPYRYRRVGQLTGQRSAKLRFVREMATK
jgi:hypothetical protein